ncbi:hypothetical protein B0T39_15280 [Chromobacterium haemolyticum]|nr:hypothetical protein B0T39_15280 [Chromobacterium haemolyticum]
MATQSGKIWTDTAEHDPGVTLLQALTYSVSDLGYRHTLPLVDLLTPELEQRSQDGLFPASFGPHQALTVSPITEDDYRRALLDLSAGDAESPQLLFRNARLLREAPAEQYRYYFDAKQREYHFTAVDGQAQELAVQGAYRLQVELNRDITQAMAEPVLLTFLHNHRNLCESVRAIDWLTAQDVDVDITLELEDDFQDYAALLAQLYLAVEHHISPQSERASAAQLRARGLDNQAIYQGPELRHGWISVLPPLAAYDEGLEIRLNPLVTTLQTMTGVKSLQTLGFNKAGWGLALKPKQYALLWGKDPLQSLADGQRVKLMKRGQQIKVTKAAIQAALPVSAVQLEAPVTLPYGRHRHPARYYPASDKIPPCYQLQAETDDGKVKHLHQYLLPFEQGLANACEQLALLPSLLSFQREADQSPYPVWGGQWPFAADSVADSVHDEYRDRLQQETASQNDKEAQELALLNHQLSLFGQQRADRTLLNAPDYLASQRAYLSQNSQLHYQAGQYRADVISAAQRRIAARLGMDQGVFDNDGELSKLPFYLIEHRALLPKQPNPAYTSWQAIKRIESAGEGTPKSLQLTVDVKLSDLQPGQLLELQYTATAVKPVLLSACVVTAVDTAAKRITLELNAQLRSYLDELIDSDNWAKVQWRNSSLWLQDISFPLQYLAADDPKRSPLLVPEEGQRIVTVDNFPAQLAPGDEIILYRHNGPDKAKPAAKQANEDVAARVVEIDALRRQALIEVLDQGPELPQEAHQTAYRWCVSRTDLADRFSFTVSAVFNEALLLGEQSQVVNPSVTEAWVRRIVQDELPCHVRAELHWLEAGYFGGLGYSYAAWAAGGANMGRQAFDLLWQLALGMLPSGLQGINAMRIATAAQRSAVVGENETEWNTGPIMENSLLYVPPAQQALPRSEF